MPDLELVSALAHPELLAPPVASAIAALPASVGTVIQAAAIDPALSDTAEFCAAYGLPLEDAANCIVVVGKRGDTTTYAACVVLATTRLDVNGVVRKLLGSRSASFAPMDDAVRMTSMEYGGISPIGLPADWRLLIDARVVGRDVTVGAGIRGAKVFAPGGALAGLPRAEVVEDLARSREG